MVTNIEEFLTKNPVIARDLAQNTRTDGQADEMKVQAIVATAGVKTAKIGD
jgi:hypothetical protein